jgi:biopolymer transport protein ExbD
MEENEFNYINVIPLVDVMLVLLTIVLTTSTFIATGAISVSLPQATPAQAETLKRQTITIDREGQIYLNETRMVLDELDRKVRDLNRDTPMILRADRSIRLQVFIDVLDLLNNNGFKKVAIQTERKG